MEKHHHHYTTEEQEKRMNLTLQDQLSTFQQKYTDLEHQASPRSVEQHVYQQINTCILTPKSSPEALQWAFETQFGLVNMAKVLDPPEKRPIIWAVVEELEQIAQLHPLR